MFYVVFLFASALSNCGLKDFYLDLMLLVFFLPKAMHICFARLKIEGMFFVFNHVMLRLFNLL